MQRFKDYKDKLTEWKKAGFDHAWLISLQKTPSTSKGCGLTGMAACSAMRAMERHGCLKRGKLMPNHLRIWHPGPCYDRWVSTIPPVTSSK